MTPPLRLKTTYCSPQYIQTIPPSHMVVSDRPVTTTFLSAGVPKMAITVFTKTPAEHLEEVEWLGRYEPGILDLDYWGRAVKRWLDGKPIPELPLPDPPSG